MDVKYVVASEFDLDLGATVKYHYPQEPHPLFDRANGFANLLIPDQAHLRQEDWTFFFLYENTRTGELEYAPNDANAKVYYVCNTLQTKYGTDVKRGAQIFSLALIAPEAYCHILKPLLLLAIDAYIMMPGAARLAEVYNSLKNIDMSRLPTFDWQEKRLLQMNQNQSLFRDYYLTKYNGVYRGHGSAGAAAAGAAGGPGGSAASLSDTHFYDVVVNYRGLKIPLRIPTDVEWYSAGDFSVTNFVNLCGKLQPIKGFHKDVSVYGPATSPLIALWVAILTGKRVIFIGDSAQVACRELCDLVLACGYFGSAGGQLNTTHRVFPYVDLARIDDLLKTDGYIAGVTNSAFLLHPEWWDVAVHIDKRRIELSAQMQRKVPERYPATFQADADFVNEATALAADRHAERAVRERLIEYTRMYLRRAASGDLENVAESLAGDGRSLATSADGGAGKDDASRLRDDTATLATQDSRTSGGAGAGGPVELLGDFGYPWASQGEKMQYATVYSTVNAVWKRQPSFYFYLKQIKATCWSRPPRPLVDFVNAHLKLKHGNLGTEEAAAIYKVICRGIDSGKDVTRFLAETASVYYLNLGLFHPSAEVREVVCKAMSRIKKHTAGVFYYLELPPYHAIALERAERNQL